MAHKSFIVFDLEYTTWEGCNQNGWHGFQKKEIVQLAAVKVDTRSLAVTESINMFVKPTHNPILSDYFINLTHITQEMVDTQGISFSQAYDKFKSFAGNLTCFSHAWNEGADSYADGNIMNINAALNSIIDNNPPHYVNIAPWLKTMYERHHIHIKRQASGEIARLLGRSENVATLGLAEHDALYDVYSLLEGIRRFNGKDLPIKKHNVLYRPIRCRS